MDDMKYIIEILGQSLINYINERTIYKYQAIHHDFVPNWVRTAEDLLTYENDIRKVNPYYTCYNGQLIYVRDEEKVYMLKDQQIPDQCLLGKQSVNIRWKKKKLNMKD